MGDELHLAHILVEQKYEAEDILRKLKEGSKFSDLAQKFSKCPSAPKGGDLGVISLARLDQAFAEAASKLKANTLSDVVRTRFGYHIIQRLD